MARSWTITELKRAAHLRKVGKKTWKEVGAELNRSGSACQNAVYKFSACGSYISFTCPPDQKYRVKLKAKESGLTTSAWIRQQIEKILSDGQAAKVD